MTNADALTRALGIDGRLYVKRDDLTSPIYGGNKVRTLEPLFGRALSAGAKRVFATGAYGTNHGLAVALHAPRVGLKPGMLLYPQPPSMTSCENLQTLLSHDVKVVCLRHWSVLPFGMMGLRAAYRLRQKPVDIMVPGGASPTGALGYVNGALELARQVQDRLVEPPRSIVVGVGSTCTAAGLLLGCVLASRAGLGFNAGAAWRRPPLIVGISVTPWPITSRERILSLAVRTSQLLASRSGRDELAVTAADLRPYLKCWHRFVRPGYGRPSKIGTRATQVFADHLELTLDSTYTAKSAAGCLFAMRRRLIPSPVLYWSTKSSAPLPRTLASLGSAPATMKRWLQRVATYPAEG